MPWISITDRGIGLYDDNPDILTYNVCRMEFKETHFDLIREVAGALLGRFDKNKPFQEGDHAEFVFEEDIPLNLTPDEPIIKMAKKNT